MPPEPSELALEEFRALRATIRERGTTRLIVTIITFVSWAALILTLYSVSVVPALGLIPLLVLAAGFEVVFAAHVGVERIGRFIQTHYETSGTLPQWEQTAMRLGQHRGISGGIDPLFTLPFILAALLNLSTIALLVAGSDGPEVAGIPIELAVCGVLHLLFLSRLMSARRFAAGQRQRDAELLRADVSGGR